MRDLLACCFPPSFRFQEMCEKAFLLARKKERPLGLFSSIVGGGLPELKQEKDVAFIRYDMHNIVALKHFPDIFFLSL